MPKCWRRHARRQRFAPNRPGRSGRRVRAHPPAPGGGVARKWVEQDGYNPAKAGGIEISNSLNFVSWSRAEQPCMVLPELAHAYHFLVLGESHPQITAPYRHAVERGLYESVDYAGGGMRRD